MTGDINGLRSKKYTNADLRFNSTIFTGDIRERIKILVDSNQMALALAAAKIHGIEDYYNDIS